MDKSLLDRGRVEVGQANAVVTQQAMFTLMVLFKQ
jgi:hypothetical protein